MATISNTSNKQRQLAPSIGLWLAAVGAFIQVASAQFCQPLMGTSFLVCAGAGIFVSIGGAICGHIALSRLTVESRSDRLMAHFGLIAAYLSAFALPIIWFGFLWLLSGMHDSL